MTPTVVINGQTIGSGANAGPNLFSINPVSLASTTTAIIASVKATTGTNGILIPGNVVRVWFATTSYTVTAANAPLQLGSTARYIDVHMTKPTVIRDSDLETIAGGKFHCWVDSPKLDVDGTVTVTLVELP